jgi:hypothetical protein
VTAEFLRESSYLLRLAEVVEDRAEVAVTQGAAVAAPAVVAAEGIPQ